MPPESPSAIAQAVLDLLAFPEKRRMFGLAGGRRFRDFFTDDKMVRRHDKTYEFYLDRKGVIGVRE